MRPIFMSSVNDIREHFLSYFEKNAHTILPSSPLVPNNDPTLMFTNSGMVQFKNIFTGMETSEQLRAVTAQKCLRAGGKHNDLDNVGYTARHHTFFEMLGNFSFGDYFKEHAIEMAWHLLTKEFAIDIAKLCVTIYYDDEEAYGHWKKITGLDDRKIIRIRSNDNFWRMGNTGPCGPCSEIFYDHGEHIAGGPPGSDNEDGDRFVEIWNLVFMQYEEQNDKSRDLLPRPSIDTGMGIERMAAVLQGTHDNYNIDLFQRLIEASQNLVGHQACDSELASHRVIADHLRTSCFLIAEGVLPSSEGRGYVLRRIMRRAMRHSYLLNVHEPLLARMVPFLVREMGAAYPELIQHEKIITDTLRDEEMRFGKTLERGIKILDDTSHNLASGDHFPGDIAFKLYDTYGFPLDLTQDALRQRNIHVDQKAFDEAMHEQRVRARQNWVGSGDSGTHNLWFELAQTISPTKFVGYTQYNHTACVQAIVCEDAIVPILSEGQMGALVMDESVFYAESGGQIGDTGTIIFDNGAEFIVTKTLKVLNEYHIHYGQCRKGQCVSNSRATLSIDRRERQLIACNHSSTHILHAALRSVLGEHVIQKGSSVTKDSFRFDFSHNHPLTPHEIRRIEYIINNSIHHNSVVETHIMDIDTAKEQGAMALFGEKYADKVRVVTMGQNTQNLSQDTQQGFFSENYQPIFSMELCGGTHVQRTGDIGFIKIISETAVSSGIRRIVAVSGIAALEWVHTMSDTIHNAQHILRTSPKEFLSKLQNVVTEKQNATQTIQTLKKKLALAHISDAANTTNTHAKQEKIGSMTFAAHYVKDMHKSDLLSLVDSIKNTHSPCVVIVISQSSDNKLHVIIGVSSSLTQKIDAVSCVRQVAPLIGGKGGGGRPDLAQAGGNDPSKINDAIAIIHTQCQKLFTNT